MSGLEIFGTEGLPRVAPARAARNGRPLDIVIFGLSITSSWGNGHATNYRALVRALDARGHRVLFLEWDAPWYRGHRDLRRPAGGDLCLYRSLDELQERHWERVRGADAVIVGSFVRDGVDLGHWVNDVAEGTTIFYDIDTPITLAKLEAGDFEYLEPSLVRRYDLYLSFTGGPVLRALERRYGSAAARAFYCMVDPDEYRPARTGLRWDLAYLGTYSADRQPALARMLLDPARRLANARMCVAGPGYPDRLGWPANVERIEHVAPPEHPAFYNRQRFTLNLTRDRMARAGWSPSVRLFEAAACGVPVISDVWEGLDHFFQPGEEILVAESADDVVRALRDTSPEAARAIGRRARRRVLGWHTAGHRARELEQHLREARTRRRAADRPTGAPSAEALRPRLAEIPYLGPSFR
ncbi:MAG TPA: glycosyltransferase [Longimicrobiales bacterium]|nr:glycosyltransferase [Longimicrobiales bacterium]